MHPKIQGAKMAEVPVSIAVEEFFLEGQYEEGSSTESGILCHPHPLYGGSMDNNVILALQSVLKGKGWGTLRFNFRGVGKSGGSYAEGEGEVRDLIAAASYLTAKGVKKPHLSGYSFGAWIVMKAVKQGLDPASVILVSPPLDLLDFSHLKLPSAPCLITLGDGDTFCSKETLHKWLEAHSSQPGKARVEVIPGCDHFYWGKEELLTAKVLEFVQGHL
jgi:alpha/beta superfamily hydrolase